jgi:hypothetical protein
MPELKARTSRAEIYGPPARSFTIAAGGIARTSRKSNSLFFP